jgi:rsbT co-antagonist protein RsbR
MRSEATTSEAVRNGGDTVHTIFEAAAQRTSTLPRTMLAEIHEQILDACDDMILVKGPKSKLLWANKAFRALYGMSNEQLYGLIDSPVNEPDYTQQYIRDDAYVFDTCERLVIPEEPVTRHDGAVRLFATVKAPLRSARGEVIGTVGISRDITEVKRAEQDLRLLEQAIGAASQGILVASFERPGMPVVYANATMERVTGNARGKLVGAPLEHVLSKVADPDAAAQLFAAITEGIEISVDFPSPIEQGRWTRLTVIPARDEGSRLTSLIAVHSDITAEKERQLHREAMFEQQHLIDRQRRTIHDLATPIIEIWEGVLTMPIIGVLDSVRAAEMTAQLLEAIRRSGARFAILDLTGVDLVDTATANYLLRLLRAVSLLGSKCMVSGISPAVSMTLVSLGVELGALRAFGSLRAALRVAIDEMGAQHARAARP